MLQLPQIITKQEEEMFLAAVAKNVKEIRKSREISQLEAALSIGMTSQGSYANMENYTNDKRFNIIHLFKLSKLFGVDIREFFVLPEILVPSSFPTQKLEVNLVENEFDDVYITKLKNLKELKS
ncbi:MAG: helix-turn-helix transcriptional regulator [Campylobacteraceae bacterium]|nr:helix-turn-helix transcriptional regulator [Campylobacteraceae bacterium]